MKLLELAAKDRKLYHRMSTEHWNRLRADGELPLKRGTLCTSHDRNANAEKDFGDILLQVDVAKLVARGAKVVDMVYDLDWLEKNGLVKHVTGMTRAEWLEYAKMSTGSADPEDANEELADAYSDEKEVVIYTDKILLDEVRRLK